MDEIYSILKTLLYKWLTIYIESYSNQPVVFSGILYQLTPQIASVLIKPAEFIQTSHKVAINFNKEFHSDVKYSPGSIVEIPLDKIDAILHLPI